MQALFEAATPHVLEIVSIGLTAVIGWGAAKARQKWGIEIESKHRDALHSALMTGARLAMARQLTGAAAVGVVLDYAKKSVPDALAYLKPGLEVLDLLAASKLNEARK
ncbi:hypothetical protein [Paracoccus sp. PAR01]|uniref:hypothetical protein n=1 Tax=Paracoccus sp. PAR01 TaxID=2769282 RepID=UPI00177B08AA|nr:hypothetical protein [Paracoccus sp. PAR01]MBD9528959.1 hypothetical protein [Paracoccus sp. PAR01]